MKSSHAQTKAMIPLLILEVGSLLVASTGRGAGSEAIMTAVKPAKTVAMTQLTRSPKIYVRPPMFAINPFASRRHDKYAGHQQSSSDNIGGHRLMSASHPKLAIIGLLSSRPLSGQGEGRGV
jgi:hypothetical protein